MSRVSRSTSSGPTDSAPAPATTIERYAGFQRVAVGGLGRRIRGSRTRLDDRFDRERALLFALSDAAADRPEHRDAFRLRLLGCARELRLRHRSWQPVGPAKSASRGVQHPAGTASGAPPSVVEPARGLRCRTRSRTSRSTTSRWIPAWSTASCSPARWSSGTSIGPTRRIRRW